MVTLEEFFDIKPGEESDQLEIAEVRKAIKVIFKNLKKTKCNYLLISARGDIPHFEVAADYNGLRIMLMRAAVVDGLAANLMSLVEGFKKDQKESSGMDEP